MGEHMFGFDGKTKMPPPRVIRALERVGKRYGLSFVTYPVRTPLDLRWAFHGPDVGRFEAMEVEAAVKAELDKDPDFRTWSGAADRTETDRVIEALENAVTAALANRAQRPEDFRLISAVRTAKEHMRSLTRK